METRTVYPTFVSDLHKAVSTDKLRPAMNCIAFVNGYAYATDGYVAVEQSLAAMNFTQEDILCTEGKLLSAKSYQLARSAERLIVHYDCITAHLKDKSVVDIYWSTETNNYPDVRGLIEKARKKPKESNNNSYFYFNAKYMNTLLSAMKFDGFAKIDIKEAASAIVVTDSLYEDDSQVGIIMPVYVEQKLFN
jgi:hypothetical protein